VPTTTLPTKPATAAEEDLPSFRDKKKFFEQEIQGNSKAKPKEKEQRFTYLSKDELDNLKQEEERKIQDSSPEKIRSSGAVEDSQEREEMGRLFGTKKLDEVTGSIDNFEKPSHSLTLQSGPDLNSNTKHASPCHNLDTNVETRQQHIVEIGFDEGDEETNLNEADSDQWAIPAPAPRSIAAPTVSSP